MHELSRLGDDQQPVLSGGEHLSVTSDESFSSWYRTDEDVSREQRREAGLSHDCVVSEKGWTVSPTFTRPSVRNT